jgi:hypothetical protein
MKKIIVILLLAPAVLHAGVVASNTAGTSISFTNTQSGYFWSPTAVIVSRDVATPVTITINRHGQGRVAKLAEISASASTLIWSPPAKFTFGKDSSLVVTSSVPGFSAQLHREPASD